MRNFRPEEDPKNKKFVMKVYNLLKSENSTNQEASNSIMEENKDMEETG